MRFPRPYPLLTLLALLLLAPRAWAGEVAVKEVSLSLYNKPVTGYRLVLDRGQATVSQHIVQHVAFFDNHKPFEYEQTIIYENIVYSPVTSNREITLYYLLRSLQDHYTELTVVAMYDYKRSVCMREFPDLAERLVADIAVLVRQTSGDVVRLGEVVYDDATLAKVGQQSAATKPNEEKSGVQNPVANETKNDQLLVQDDPFRKAETFNLPTQDSMQRMIIAQRRMLEEKEEELRIKEKALEEDQRRYAQNQNAMAEVKVLRDSVERLNRRIQNLIRAEYSGDASTSTDGNEKLLRTQEQLAKVSAERGALNAKYDSLAAAQRRTQGELTLAQQQRDEFKDKYQAERLRAEMSSGNATADAALRSENDQLKKDLADARNQKALLERQLAATGSSAGLRDSIRLLQSRITLLERTSGDNTAQQETISRQQAQLQAKDQQLKALEQKQLANRSELEQAAARTADLERQLKASQDQFQAQVAKGSATASQIETLQQQLKSLTKDLAEVDRQMTDMNNRLAADQDTIGKLRGSLREQQKAVADRDKVLRDTRDLMDTLRAALAGSEATNSALRLQQQSLQKKVDSLAIYAASPGEQQAFVREQWKKLQDWETKLNDRERSIADQEKLVAQREAYLKTREQENAQQELRYQNLQERENRIKLREQQLGIPSDGSIPPPSGGSLPTKSSNGGGTSSKVVSARIKMGTSEVPVYSFTSTKNYGELQKQVIGYMVSLGKYHDSMIPDITYSNTSLPEIVNEPLEVRFMLQAVGSGTQLQASFRIPGGAYVDPNTTQELHGRALLFMEKLANW
jgi:hypothetical protein